jgi:hypothetical protein
VIDRQTGFLLPPSVDEWLPEKHLARFVVEVVFDPRSREGSDLGLAHWYNLNAAGGGASGGGRSLRGSVDRNR